jgi:hypothetical protein
MSVMTISQRHMMVMRWLMILMLIMMITSINLIKPATAKVTLVEVTAEGLGMSQKDAIMDALKTAIGQVNGISVSSQVISRISSQVVDTDTGSQFISSTDFIEDISTATDGHVDSFAIISTRTRPDFNNAIEVILKVNVAKFSASPQLNRLRLAVIQPHLDNAIANRADAPGFASDLRREVEDYLTQTRRFAMIDRAMMSDTQAELNLIATAGMATREGVRLGQRVGSDYLVILSIHDLGRITKQRQILGTTNILQEVRDETELSVRIIDVATSQIKFASTQRYSVDPAQDALDSHAAFRLGEMIANAIYPAQVVAVDGASLTIGQGGITMTRGTEYHLVALGERLADPYSGESIGRKETIIGRALITSVQSKQATAEVLMLEPSGQNFLKPGQTILRPIYPDPLAEANLAAQEMEAAKSKIETQKQNFFEE